MGLHHSPEKHDRCLERLKSPSDRTKTDEPQERLTRQNHPHLERHDPTVSKKVTGQIRNHAYGWCRHAQPEKSLRNLANEARPADGRKSDGPKLQGTNLRKVRGLSVEACQATIDGDCSVLEIAL